MPRKVERPGLQDWIAKYDLEGRELRLRVSEAHGFEGPADERRRTPVELITAPSAPTLNIKRMTSRRSLFLAFAMSRSPIRRATPVRTSPLPITKSIAISTTLPSAKPASASSMLSTPVSGRAVSMRRPTASILGRPTANMKIATASSARTTERSAFM